MILNDIVTNHRFIKALRREPVDQTPVWIMRQAGRYLPEYRKIREKAGNFLTLCKTPELAAEVTLQPLARFPLDAAIIFSDILTIPDAMGLGLYFSEGEGPRFQKAITCAADIQTLPLLEPEDELGYVMQAIKLVKQQLAQKVPLIGFAGSPWTVACYMIDGGSSKDFAKTRSMMYKDPALLEHLLEKLITNTARYLNAQIAAGADVVMLFDTWGGLLTPETYQQFSLQPMQRILQQLDNPNIPTILFTKNGGQWLEKTASSGCSAVGLDWTINIGEARQRIGEQVALQGNFDPALLAAAPKNIEAGVEKILADYGVGSGHVFNLGHGITPNIQPEHLAILVNAVHEKSRAYHQ